MPTGMRKSRQRPRPCTASAQSARAVSGKAYTQFVQEEIFIPLGMNRTFFPLAFLPAGSFARAYDDLGQALPQEFTNSYASGGVYSTPSDMVLCAARLRHVAGTQWGSKRYLNLELLQEQDIDKALELAEAV